MEFFSSLPEPLDSIIVSLEGRAYPVQIAYLEEPTNDYVRKAAETVISIHKQVRLFSTCSRNNPNPNLAWQRGHPCFSNWSRRNRQLSGRIDGWNIFVGNLRLVGVVEGC